jgi:hypothetical protein
MDCQGRCGLCHRRNGCRLRGFMEMTLPWADQAAKLEGEPWDRAVNVARALRGYGDSPGFTVDAREDHALTMEDVREMITRVTMKGFADMGMLTSSCRHYVGP